MKGNIMDKKILLGGAAALLLVGNMYATPANAAIDLSIGGEAKLTANMSECYAAATATDIEALIEAVEGAAISSAAANATAAEVSTHVDGLGSNGASLVADDTVALTHSQTCGGNDRSGVDWGFGKELAIDASGTLANGLEVSFSDTLDLTDTNAETGGFDLTLGGAFGSLQFKDGAPSAVDAAMVTGKKNLDVQGQNLGAHPTETDGSAGMGILWSAPSMSSLDLFVGWAPNSGGDGLDDAAYENTFSIGAVVEAGGMEIGAGFESASHATGCTANVAGDFVAGTAQSIVNAAYQGDYCGDQTLTYVGATMSAGDIGLSAGYSILDTDEADKTTMSIGASTSFDAYDVAIDYRNSTKDYLNANVEDTQSVVAVEVGTSLGDGVDLGVVFSTSDADFAAEAAGAGSITTYFVEASLTVGF